VGDVTTSTGNLICATISTQSINSTWATMECATPLTGQYLYVRNSVASEVVIREIQVQGTEVLTKVWPDFCEKCPTGTYKAVPGNVPCTACPSNTFSATLAGTNSSLCLTCPANSVSDTGSQQCGCVAGFDGSADVCRACPLGTFKGAIGDISCATCPANSIMAENASSLVMPCTCLSGFEPR
jgi:Tyrosine-protein kinase ephrin type A/B receptor-like